MKPGGKGVPLWKIRRELRRLGHQALSASGSLGTRLFGALYYDLFLSGKIVRTAGEVAASSKVAVYLIFPNLGLQASHLRSLAYLVSKGYAPIVVSNLSLSPEDRDKLLPLCHQCVERPNFGYDFGGYRDGVLTVRSRLPDLDHLLLINDSTWFALPGCRDWLADAEALNVDLAAAASNYGIQRVDHDAFRDISWNYCTTHRNFHYCSFALLFSKRILADRGFLRFWRWFPLTNKKNRTVRRGEIGLSKWTLSRGFTHGVTYDVAGLDADLAALDDDRLAEVARQLIVPEDLHLLETKRDLLSGTPDRQELIRLILTGVARQGSSYALADFAINECGFPFLKKSPVWLNHEASDITLRLAEALPGQAGEEILSEAKELRRARAPQFDRSE